MTQEFCLIPNSQKETRTDVSLLEIGDCMNHALDQILEIN